MFRFLTATLILLSIPSLATAQTVGGEWNTHYQFDGPSAWDSLGWWVSGAGDVNADGFDDVILGVFETDYAGLNSGSAFVQSGKDGSLLYHWNGEAPDDKFGYSVSGAGDLNGDQFPDLLVGTRNKNMAYAFSGADGSLLFSWSGNTVADRFGQRVNAAGDINNDGYDDVIISALYADPGGRLDAGSVHVYSGLDGSMLLQWDGANQGDLLGSSIAGIGDINGDGFDDVVLGAQGADPGGFSDAGSVFAFSGNDGSLLHQWDALSKNIGFGNSVSSAGDVDLDGIGDIIAAASNVGVAVVLSGRDGSLLHEWRGTNPTPQGSLFGYSVSGVGDVNGDGNSDVIVGEPWERTNGYRTGVAHIFSGADGTLLKKFNGENKEMIGWSVSGAGDVDGDGLRDVVIGAPHANSLGAAYVHGFSPFIEATATELSVATGGTIDLQLDFPIEAAGLPYKVLASSSGMGPIHFGIDIPLTYDAAVQRTWNGGYTGATEGRLHGTLDNDGRASATLRITAGNWSHLIATKFHFAAIALGANGIPVASSVAVPVTITP